MDYTDVVHSLESELQNLFGENSYCLERKACTGKYRGHTDYTLVFGSGRRLYIGLDKRNYLNGLRDKLKAIRHFREHQAENTRRINDLLSAHDTPYLRGDVEIVPYDSTKSLAVYAAVILTAIDGVQFVYRTSTMHGYLIGYDAPCFDFDSNAEHMLKDICGEMSYTSILNNM